MLIKVIVIVLGSNRDSINCISNSSIQSQCCGNSNSNSNWAEVLYMFIYSRASGEYFELKSCKLIDSVFEKLINIKCKLGSFSLKHERESSIL